MQQIKNNKSSLNAVIEWSSSRYNDKKKIDVINEIIFLVEKGEDVYVCYGTGSYYMSGHLGGWDYILEIKNGVAILTEERTKRTQYEIIKLPKNKIYTAARRFKVRKGKYPWHSEIIGKEFNVKNEGVYTYDFEVLLDGQLKTMTISKNLVDVIY